MGIRIRRYLGWGLTDVKTRDGKIVDPRFSEFMQGHYSDHLEQKAEEFLPWVDQNRSEASQIICKANNQDHNEEHPTWAFGDLFYMIGEYKQGNVHNRLGTGFIHDGEAGLSRVALFQPIICTPDWTHHDDTIDYYDANCTPRSKVKMLTNKSGIYPFLGMVRIPGTVPSCPAYGRKMEGGEYNQLVGRWDKRNGPLVDGDRLKDLLENYRPSIAQSVILFTYFSGIFTNWESTIHQLRPMIYTYWS